LSTRVYNQPVAGSVKERFTGALIFLAVVVVIVPEMFSGPQPRPAATAPGQPAESGLPLRTYSMTLNDSGETRAPAPTVPAPAASSPAMPAAQVSLAEPMHTEPMTAEPVPVAAIAADLPPESAATSTPGGSWWLQVGIFSSRDNAERLARKLQASGFAVDMGRYQAGGKEMFRVRAGPVRDRAEALALQGRLAASGNNSYLLPP
jgi:cell division septation protein DedD